MRLKAEHMSIGYDKSLCEQISIDFADSGLHALIGRNGSGKSTLLRTLCGLIEPIRGKLTIDGRELSTIPYAERASLIALVTADLATMDQMTVHELVSLGRIPYAGRFGKLTRQDHEKIEEAVDQVGISDLVERLVSGLSDGEKQKAAIAKALAQDTPIILLDEPTAFLDISSRVQLLKSLKKSSKEKLVIFSSHDLSLSAQLTESLLVLNEGRLTVGSADQLLENGSLDALFDPDSVYIQPADYRIIVK